MNSGLKLYTDVHIAAAIATELTRRGVDVVRCQDVGMHDAEDVQHLEYASAEGQAVVSNDSDFTRLHNRWMAEGRSHAGIFYIVDNPYLIGFIVNELADIHDLIVGGAGDLETDIYNRLFYVG